MITTSSRPDETEPLPGEDEPTAGLGVWSLGGTLVLGADDDDESGSSP